MSSRVFVGFSSTDIHYYHLMCAWKNNSKIDFNFIDCQLHEEIDSEDELYIKRKCFARSVGILVLLGFDVTIFTPATYQRHSL